MSSLQSRQEMLQIAYYKTNKDEAFYRAYRLNSNRACSVGLHVNAVLIRQWWQRRIVDHYLGSSILGQLLKHVVGLIEVQCNTYALENK